METLEMIDHAFGILVSLLTMHYMMHTENNKTK